MEKRIGFVGCYSHDIILLLAKVFWYMEKSVLIRDCNKRHTLHASVPIPENVNIKKEEAEYDGVFFTERNIGDAVGEYDIELIDFGMDTDEIAETYCTDWVVVTDMLPHHIKQLEQICFSRERTRVCILRDAFEEICVREPELQRFLGSFPGKEVFFLPPDFRDVRNRYVCETLHEYSVGRASPEMRDLICRIAVIFCGTYSEKEIRRRVKQLERRRYR